MDTGVQTEPPPTLVDTGTHPILAFTDTGIQTEPIPVLVTTSSTVAVQTDTPPVPVPPPIPRTTPSQQPPTLPAPSLYDVIHNRTPHVLAAVFPYHEARNA